MLAETAKQQLSFEDYLHYHDDADGRYELVDGELVPMAPPTLIHVLIAKQIEQAFDREIKRLGRSWLCLREVGVRTGLRKSRLLDVCVVTVEQARRLMNQAAVFDAPPLLAVEIVSEGSRKRDYRYKRSEYAATEIPEYWIVDPLQDKISVLSLQEGLYEASEFSGNERVVSAIFNKLDLTAADLLAGETSTGWVEP